MAQKHDNLDPQKRRKPEEIGNWRPISLVNSDAKIFMKILPGRLNVVCKDIIAIHQQGIISGRLITDAVLDILTTLRSHRESYDQHWLLLIDQAKAFDRVKHDYLKGVLKKMNFHAQFIEIVGNLFVNQETYIIGNNELSRPFKVGRGVRQGDPLSPLLYVIAFEPLLAQIKKQITGLPLGSSHFKLAAYADDLSIGLGTRSDWSNLSKLLQTYEAASNVKINKKKFKIIPLNLIYTHSLLTI